MRGECGLVSSKSWYAGDLFRRIATAAAVSVAVAVVDEFTCS